MKGMRWTGHVSLVEEECNHVIRYENQMERNWEEDRNIDGRIILKINLIEIGYDGLLQD